jgi:hypothetical protein
LLSHIKLRSGRSADLRALRWCSIGRLVAGWGLLGSATYLVAIYLLTRGKQGQWLLHLKWKNLFAEVQIGGQWVGSQEANTQEAPLPDRPPKSYAPHAPWRVCA